MGGARNRRARGSRPRNNERVDGARHHPAGIDYTLVTAPPEPRRSRPELKYSDLIGLAGITNATPSTVAITTPAGGTTNTTRIGNRIRVRAFDLLLNAIYSGGSTTLYQQQIFQARLFRYKKTSSTSGATPPSLSELLVVDANSDYSPLSLVNPNTCDNFQILTDSILSVDLNFGVASNVAGNSRLGLHRVECDFEMEFNSSSATGVCNNMVFVALTALNPANASGSSNVYYNVRMYFEDS